MIELKTSLENSTSISLWSAKDKSEMFFSFEKTIYKDQFDVRYIIFTNEELESLSKNDKKIVLEAFGFVAIEECLIDGVVTDTSCLFVYSY